MNAVPRRSKTEAPPGEKIGRRSRFHE